VASGLGAVYRPGGEDVPPPHDWSAFDVHLYVEAPPEAVLSRWRTAHGVESFFVGKASFADPSGGRRAPDEPIVTGDSYDWQFIHDFRIDGTIREATPTRIAFTFGERYAVEVTASPHGSGTLLRLHQSGMADTAEDRVQGSLNCRSCWIYFLTALKALAEGGTDLRDPNPETADAIAVGYAPTPPQPQERSATPVR